MTTSRQTAHDFGTPVVLIGGGGAPAIDRLLVSLTKKENPAVLIFATAMSDDPEWIQMTVEQFTPFCNRIEVLRLITSHPDNNTVHAAIEAADLIYVTGGETEVLMNAWREYNIPEQLFAAHRRGAVLSGSSAGGICWSYAGFNDFSDGSYRFLPGIAMVPFWYGPHYQDEHWCDFDTALPPAMQKAGADAPQEAFALTNNTVIVVRGQERTFYRVSEQEHIYHFLQKDGSMHKNEVEYSTL